MLDFGRESGEITVFDAAMKAAVDSIHDLLEQSNGSSNHRPVSDLLRTGWVGFKMTAQSKVGLAFEGLEPINTESCLDRLSQVERGSGLLARSGMRLGQAEACLGRFCLLQRLFEVPDCPFGITLIESNRAASFEIRSNRPNRLKSLIDQCSCGGVPPFELREIPSQIVQGDRLMRIGLQDRLIQDDGIVVTFLDNPQLGASEQDSR